MQLDLQRTIVAVSSPLAAAQRAIVRLSGAETTSILGRVLSDQSEIPSALLRANCFPAEIDLQWHGRMIDCAVYLWPNDRSFTGEPCAELHFLGSLPIVSRVVERLTAAGASPAERGEFALRSFLAGKLDLVQAEAILGVIESAQLDQLQWALGQLGGNISQPVRALRSEIMEMLAHLEAGLDFVEEDIEFITVEQLRQRLAEIGIRIDKLREQLNSRGAGNRDFELAIIGFPNAGKSSLFNCLLGLDRTIVSEQAGTTRDVVTAKLSLQGLTINLIDTAGVEEVLESSARAMAQTVLRDRIQTCDAILLCVDLSSPISQAWFDSMTATIMNRLGLQHQTLLTIGTKSDLRPPAEGPCNFDQIVSVHDPSSIESLKSTIERLVHSHQDQQFTQATHHTAVRCRHALHHAACGIAQALDVLLGGGGEELVASELHCVLDDLASIIGEVHNDDILGEIFSRFCIGK